MAEFGLTPTGFNRKPLSRILSDIETRELTNIDPAFDISPDSIEGQINGIFSSHLGEGWEVLEAVNNSLNPQNAKDAQLDNSLSLRGTPRQPPKKSVLPSVSVDLEAGKLLSAGAVVRVVGKPEQRFVSISDIENISGITDTFTVDFEAENEGDLSVNVSTIEIAEPQTGWLSADNTNTTQVGRNKEEDSDYLTRSDIELRAIGGATPDAIKGDVQEVEGVQTVEVLYNDDDAPDADGLPGHSVEAIIFDGLGNDADDNAVAQAIWDTKAGGVKAFGAESGTAIDTEGKSHVVNFSRPVKQRIEIQVEITYRSTGYAGDAAVAQALADYGNALGASLDAITEQFEGVLFRGLGVWDKVAFVHNIFGGTPSADNIEINARQIATYDVADIVVIASVTPTT